MADVIQTEAEETWEEYSPRNKKRGFKGGKGMSFLKVIYFGCAGIAFFTLVNDIFVLRWHNWEGHFFNVIPSGEIIGWFEVIVLSFLGLISFGLALKEFFKPGKVEKNGRKEKKKKT